MIKSIFLRRMIKWIACIHTPSVQHDSIFYNRGWERKNFLLRTAGLQISKEGVVIGSGFQCLDGNEENITIERYVAIGHNFRLWNFNEIIIGQFCMIAAGVTVSNGWHDKSTFEPASGRVMIGPGCWIGVNATIVGSVTIGANSIIGAGALVNKDVPPNSIVVGVPAKVIGLRTLPVKVWHLGNVYFDPESQNIIINNKENITTMQQLIEKEKVIQELLKAIEEREKVIQELLKAIEEREKVIQEQSKALENYHQLLILGRPLLPVFRVMRRMKNIMRPRLGNLNQYAPRPLIFLPPAININQLVKTPKVSIVTPSFRQASYIERTIQSVLNQQYPNLEYFIQDGGSEDDTTAVLKRYEEKLTGWVSEKDNGQSQAINLGFAKTNGEIMAWLNSDDLLLPGALAVVVNYFNTHPDVDVIYGNRLLIDENDMEIGRWILPGHDSNVLSWADYVPQETMFWRRSIWDKVGGQIDESFKFAMDWDLLVRFRDAGAKFAHIPHFLGAFRIHAQQKTSAAINEIGHQEMDRIRERLLGRVPARKEIRNKVIPFMFKHIVVDFFYRIKLRINTFPTPHLRQLK